MSEKLQRTESLQPLLELTKGLVQEMGEQPQQRLDWLMQQTGESFGDVLLQVNSTARGLDEEEHIFDGDGVQAGTSGGSIPPDQEDKITLLNNLVSATQRHIITRSEKGDDPQMIVSELAVAIPTVVNKLHLFAGGNGRTSRILRMVLRDGDQITPEKVEVLVHKKGFERYDAIPTNAVETSIMRYMKNVNGTSEIAVTDDVIDEDTFADEVHEDITRMFPSISPNVVKAYSDTNNFSETVRLLGKEKGVGTITLSELFGQITDSPDELARFTAVYRGVRKQRVELLIGGLTGEIPIPLSVHNKEEDISKWINDRRIAIGLVPIDSAHIDSAQDFQIAYCETFAPQRVAA